MEVQLLHQAHCKYLENIAPDCLEYPLTLLFLQQLLEDYPKCFIVGADNVGSKQMQQIRMSLRGSAVVLMGKNTMMRKAIRGHVERNAALEKLLPHIKGNIGFVFTRGDLVDVRDKLLENKVRAPARAGAIAPLSVVIPAQNTGLGPEKTSFFQALSIPTKISKGTIEIIVSLNFVFPEFTKFINVEQPSLKNMIMDLKIKHFVPIFQTT